MTRCFFFVSFVSFVFGERSGTPLLVPQRDDRFDR